MNLNGLRRKAPGSVLPTVELATGLVDGYTIFDSPLGEVAVAFNPLGVSSVDLADPDHQRRFLERFGRRLLPARPPKGWGARIAHALEAGRPGALPLDLRSTTAFRQQALGFVASIPRGEVRSYAWVARSLGHPGAVRAVGSALAQNPVPLIIPCHRVVRSDGHIGEYSLGGTDHKRILLAAEGAAIGDRLSVIGNR